MERAEALEQLLLAAKRWVIRKGHQVDHDCNLCEAIRNVERGYLNSGTAFAVTAADYAAPLTEKEIQANLELNATLGTEKGGQ